MPGLYTGVSSLALTTGLLVQPATGGGNLLADSWWAAFVAPDGTLPGAVSDLNAGLFAVPALGPELVPAEGLGNPALWGAGTGWSLSGGVATKSAGTGAYLQLLGFTPTPGKTYQITTVVATRTAGAMQVTLGGVDGGGRAAAGTYVEYTTAATEDFITTSGLAIYGNSAFAGSVSSISVREVLLGDVGANLAASGYTMSTSGTGATSVESPAGKLTLTPAASGTARADFQLTGLTVGGNYLIGSTTETNAASIAVGTTQGAGDVMVATTAVGVSSIFMFVATATTQWLRFSRGNTTGAAVVSRIYVARFSPRPALRDATFDEVFSYTCSSTTARTYIDAAGVMRNDLAIDQPRWDWSTGRRRLLLEGQSTNLVLNSAEMDHASWSKSGVTVTADATTSPTGATDMDKVVEDASSGSHIEQQFYAGFTSGTPYTVSLHAKAAERSFVWLFLPSAAFGVAQIAYFNLATGAVGTTSGTPTAKMTALQNGVYRCCLTATATTTAGGNTGFGIAATNGTSSYQGVAGNGIYAWGAHLEAQSFASSYIPTTSATVTRAVESAKLSPLAQAVVSRAACTIAARGKLENPATSARAIFGNDSSGTLLYATAASNTLVSNWNGATRLDGTLGSGAFNTTDFGAALAFDSCGRAVAGNGGAAGTDTNQVGFKSVTYLGRSPGASIYGDGWYDAMVLYPHRISNTNLPLLAVAAS